MQGSVLFSARMSGTGKCSWRSEDKELSLVGERIVEEAGFELNLEKDLKQNRRTV